MKSIGTLGLIALLAAVAVGVGGCGDNAKDCYDKGDAKACSAICETGKPDALPACYEVRAREALACAEGKGDCAKSCANWKNAKVADNIKNIYIAKLGTDAKVAALEQKCK
jgi:hypothetical protein